MKVAILALAHPDLYEIRSIRALCSNLVSAGDQIGHSLAITLGIPKEASSGALKAWREDLPVGVLSRSFQWEPIPADNAARMFPNLDFDYLGISNVHVPRDWGWNFRDADIWIVHADAAVGAILPLRPTFLFVRDISERYIVSRAGNSHDRIERLLSWRQVDKALVYDSAIVGDLVSFVGMQSRKASLFGPTVPAITPNQLHSDFFDSDVFCFSAFRDEATLRSTAEGILHFVQRNPSASVIVGFDGICDPFEEVADRIRRFLALIPSHLQKTMRVHHFENEFEWDQAMRATQVAMSPRLYPSEPDDLVTTLTFGKRFVGLSTPQSMALENIIEQSIFLYRSIESQDIGQTLEAAFKAIRDREAPSLLTQSKLLDRLQYDALASTVSIVEAAINVTTSTTEPIDV